MKKIQIVERVVIYGALAAVAILSQSCGKGTNNANPVTAAATGSTSCSVWNGSSYVTEPCPTSTTPPNSTLFSQCNGQVYTVPTTSGNVQVCRYQSPYQNFDLQAESISLTSPSSVASGGTVTNVQLYPGDKFYVGSYGHYSLSNGNCNGNGGGDISVLGNSNGKDPSVNPANGMNVGLWFAFENTSAQYTTATLATVQITSSSDPSPQEFSVPSTEAGPLNLVLGYNSASSINCGDMGIYYSFVRCVDANGNTYACQ